MAQSTGVRLIGRPPDFSRRSQDTFLAKYEDTVFEFRVYERVGTQVIYGKKLSRYTIVFALPAGIPAIVGHRPALLVTEDELDRLREGAKDLLDKLR